MESRKLTMQVMFLLSSYQKLFFITCLLFLYAAYFIIFMSRFDFVLESILNQSCLLL